MYKCLGKVATALVLAVSSKFCGIWGAALDVGMAPVSGVRL